MCRYVAPERWPGAPGGFRCKSCHCDYLHDFAYALVGDALCRRLHAQFSIEKLKLTPSDKVVGARPPLAERVDHPLLDKPFMFCAYSPAKLSKNGAGSTSYDLLKESEEKSERRPRSELLEERRHARRFLLHAECQIGKTGTYLSLIDQLQQRMRERPIRQEWVVGASDPAAVQVSMRSHP